MKLKSIIITSAVLCLSVPALAACGKQQKETETAGTTETVTKASDTATSLNKIATDEQNETQTVPEDPRVPYVKGTYNEYLKWKGQEHKACSDDSLELSGNELMQSIISGRHSFTYRAIEYANYFGREMYAVDGSLLNMDEMLHLVSLSRYKLAGYTLVDLDGNGEKELVVKCESYISDGYIVFYTIGSEGYMTFMEGRQIGQFKTSGMFMGPGGEPSYLIYDKDKAYMKYMAWYETNDDGEDVYYVEGSTGGDFSQYVEDWKANNTDCTFLPVTDDTIKEIQIS